MHVFAVSAWVSSGNPRFILQFKGMHDSKLNVGLNVPWVGDLSRVYPASYPMTAGRGSIISKDKWKQMDGWLHFILLGSTCTEVRRVYVKDG